MYEPKAYEIERAVFGGKFVRQFERKEGMSIKDQSEVAHALADALDWPMPTMRRRYGGLHIGSWARPSENLISMGPTAGPALVCHEFAHLLAPGKPWHGIHWQEKYVECVAVALGGFHANRLHRAFRRTK